jgi:predicted DNA binding CopG/RHH family protein
VAVLRVEAAPTPSLYFPRFLLVGHCRTLPSPRPVLHPVGDPLDGVEDRIRVISVRDANKKEVDWSKSERSIFPNLKSSSESISLRLPSPLLARIKVVANDKDVPYQSLMKVYLSERVEQELRL